jgi:nitrite reductase/ring-hydroxylating ferredoxin subunit
MVSMSSTPTHWHQLPNAPSPGALLGRVQELNDGEARMLVWSGTEAADKPFRYLLLRSGTGVHAYVNRCAHFGVPLAQKQEQLMFLAHTSITCNVHYARYDWQTGRCLGGDCEGEGLLPIPVAIDAQGHIRIASA